jgi:hypothetical protein
MSGSNPSMGVDEAFVGCITSFAPYCPIQSPISPVSMSL